jgi:hypothetical protein
MCASSYYFCSVWQNALPLLGAPAHAASWYGGNKLSLGFLICHALKQPVSKSLCGIEKY